MHVLKNQARRINQWRPSLRAVYVYVDSDQAAYAAKNASALKAMLND